MDGVDRAAVDQPMCEAAVDVRDRIAPVPAPMDREQHQVGRRANGVNALGDAVRNRVGQVGDTVDARLPDGSRINAVIVPEQALTKRNEGTGVFVVNEDGTSVSWREVAVGIREGDRVQVEGRGLTGQVVVIGQQLIKDGALIAIADNQDASADGQKGADTP